MHSEGSWFRSVPLEQSELSSPPDGHSSTRFVPSAASLVTVGLLAVSVWVCVCTITRGQEYADGFSSVHTGVFRGSDGGAVASARNNATTLLDAAGLSRLLSRQLSSVRTPSPRRAAQSPVRLGDSLCALLQDGPARLSVMHAFQVRLLRMRGARGARGAYRLSQTKSAALRVVVAPHEHEGGGQDRRRLLASLLYTHG